MAAETDAAPDADIGGAEVSFALNPQRRVDLPTLVEDAKHPGKLPAFSSAMQSITGSAAKRFGVRFATGMGLEWGAEFGQDSAPHAVQSILAALEKDLPQTRWREIYGEWFSGENQTQLFAVLLPLSM